MVVYCKKNYVKLRTYPIFACYFIRRLRSTKAKLSRPCASPKSCPILVIFLLNSRFNQWNAMVGWRMLSFNFQFLEAPYCLCMSASVCLCLCLSTFMYVHRMSICWRKVPLKVCRFHEQEFHVHNGIDIGSKRYMGPIVWLHMGCGRL